MGRTTAMRQTTWMVAVAAVGAAAFSLAGAGAQAAPATTGGAPAQGGPAAGSPRQGQGASTGRVMGEVTAVAGSTLTVKTEDGSTVQVVTTDNTRLMKERGPVRVADLHPGDGLMAVGNLDAATKTLHAAMVFAEDAAQVKAMRENLGKTYITGRVTAIDAEDAKLTVERADHVSQTIGFDETTSFKRAVRGGRGTGAGGEGGGAGEGGSGERRGPGGGGLGGMALGGGIDRAFEGGESITLADIKVGDYLAGTGALKNGTFVPTRVVDSPPGARRGRGGSPGDAPRTGAPTP